MEAYISKTTLKNNLYIHSKLQVNYKMCAKGHMCKDVHIRIVCNNLEIEMSTTEEKVLLYAYNIKNKCIIATCNTIGESKNIMLGLNCKASKNMYIMIAFI